MNTRLKAIAMSASLIFCSCKPSQDRPASPPAARGSSNPEAEGPQVPADELVVAVAAVLDPPLDRGGAAIPVASGVPRRLVGLFPIATDDDIMAAARLQRLPLAKDRETWTLEVDFLNRVSISLTDVALQSGAVRVLSQSDGTSTIVVDPPPDLRIEEDIERVLYQQRGKRIAIILDGAVVSAPLVLDSDIAVIQFPVNMPPNEVIAIFRRYNFDVDPEGVP
jgi:hypothetical protein